MGEVSSLKGPDLLFSFPLGPSLGPQCRSFLFVLVFKWNSPRMLYVGNEFVFFVRAISRMIKIHSQGCWVKEKWDVVC